MLELMGKEYRFFETTSLSARQDRVKSRISGIAPSSE